MGIAMGFWVAISLAQLASVCELAVVPLAVTFVVVAAYDDAS